MRPTARSWPPSTAEALAGRLVVNDTAAVPGSLGAAQAGLVYMHVIFETRDAVPHKLEHRLSGVVGARPFSETAGIYSACAADRSRLRLATPGGEVHCR